MSLHKPQTIPKYLLLSPEPRIYHRPMSTRRKALMLLLLSATLTGTAALRAYPPAVKLPAFAAIAPTAASELGKPSGELAAQSAVKV